MRNQKMLTQSFQFSQPNGSCVGSRNYAGSQQQSIFEANEKRKSSASLSSKGKKESLMKIYSKKQTRLKYDSQDSDPSPHFKGMKNFQEQKIKISKKVKRRNIESMTGAKRLSRQASRL